MSDKEPQKLPDKVPVRYEISADHRVVHADGVVTSITPQLEFQARFYETLMPAPRPTFHMVSPEGELKQPTEEALDPEIVRQMNVSLVLNPVTVIKVIGSWRKLLEHLKEIGNEQVRVAIEQAEASEVTEAPKI